MNPIMYYTPGNMGALTDATYAELIAKLGLSHLRGTNVQSRRVEAGGPDGGSGILFAPYVSKTPDRIGYFPNEQTWSKCGDYWMGVFTGALVSPESLQRERQPVSRMWNVILTDEQEWTVPVARWPYPMETIGESILPQRRTLDANGNEVKRTVDSLRKLDEECHWFYEQYLRITSGEISEIDMDRVVDVAVCAIEAMYHVSRREIMLLGLLTDECAREVCEAATGITAVERMQQAAIDAQKKTDET